LLRFAALQPETSHLFAGFDQPNTRQHHGKRLGNLLSMWMNWQVEAPTETIKAARQDRLNQKHDW
jgi:hypothetical protein